MILGTSSDRLLTGIQLTSLAILIVSHNQPVRRWPVQPTVYLAIAAAVANVAIGFARYCSGPISWWHSASRGDSIEGLERHWEAGHSVVLALKHNVRMGLPGFATIVVALMIIDGPLLQRATTVHVATQAKNVTLALNLAPEVPRGFSGFGQNFILHENGMANQVFVDWRNAAPITLDAQPCNGTCQARLLAPGLAQSNCSRQDWPITLEMTQNPNATWGRWKGFDPASGKYSNPLLYASLGHLPRGIPQRSEITSLVVGLLQWSDTIGVDPATFAGSYVETACWYVPAILKYEVSIRDTEVTVLDYQGRVVDTANNTRSFDATLPVDLVQPITVDAISTQLGLALNTNATVAMVASPGSSWSVDPTSPCGAQIAKYYDFAPGSSTTGIHLFDPTADILAAVNELYLRAGVATSRWANLTSLMDPGQSATQVLAAVQATTEDVYKSDLAWFAGAAVLEILAVLFVAPLFWGWWRLGRVGMLSPFELALAFDAPILKEANSATGVPGIIKQMGETKVRFGAVANASEGHEAKVGGRTSPRLGFGRMDDVIQPRDGEHFHR
ncbi:hypothetical protein LTR53_017683 [Teratosphaeriaceae sp. CCFEE 6253]|nr:hypothetical protein LTR53_017683 [Teratosphaeriaceae sp. CCFEE 6253]